MHPDLIVTWTQQQETAAVKAQQRQPPPPMDLQPMARMGVLGCMGRHPEKRWSQAELAGLLRKSYARVHVELKALVASGEVVEIDTQRCTRDGARFLYVRGS